MISRLHINNWRQQAPWPSSAMVEQDLIISRVLVTLYQHPKIHSSLLFRGGTALNKLYLQPPARYSEDIDFVQIKAEPIGETLNAIRSVLDSWLGTPKRKISERSVKLIYKYQSIDNIPAKLKIEINTTEHFHVLEPVHYDFVVESKWFSGAVAIYTYHIDELMATKIRALYQRKKGRDLFDIWHTATNNLFNLKKAITILEQYNQYNKQNISCTMFEQSFSEKQDDVNFQNDIVGLLPIDYNWDFKQACELVCNKLVPLMRDGQLDASLKNYYMRG